MLRVLENGPFYDNGLRFSCIRCSACCRFESGYVFLSRKDVNSLKAALNMGYEDFTKVYCRWIPSANGELQLSLKEKSNYDCVFWDGKCTVYEARPLQCRSFPFWQSIISNKTGWETSAKSCPGMNKGTFYSKESIKKWLAARQNEPIITRSLNSKGES